jgi:hypothetical protein
MQELAVAQKGLEYL